jgi:hypothetical protein
LRAFIFDDIDVLLRSNAVELEKIRNITDNFVMKSQQSKPHQRIFCGREWTPEVEDLYLKIVPLPDPVQGIVPTIFIQSPNIAVRYSDMVLKFHHIPDGSTAKLKTLVRKLLLLLKGFSLV